MCKVFNLGCWLEILETLPETHVSILLRMTLVKIFSWCFLMCSLSLLSCVNEALQCWQPYGRSPECWKRCRTNELLWRNWIPHSLHLYCFSDLWTWNRYFIIRWYVQMSAVTERTKNNPKIKCSIIRKKALCSKNVWCYQSISF